MQVLRLAQVVYELFAKFCVHILGLHLMGAKVLQMLHQCEHAAASSLVSFLSRSSTFFGILLHKVDEGNVGMAVIKYVLDTLEDGFYFLHCFFLLFC